MSNIFIICGKSSSGKDTIFRRVLEEEGLSLKRIIPYTTRPIRSGESEGNEYHFVTEEELEDLKEKGVVIEERSYNTVHGVWTYFTVDEGFEEEDEDLIMIATPEAVKSMKRYFVNSVGIYPIYITVDDGIRLQRALNRELREEHPKYEEMCRRFLADAEDFSEERLKEAGIDIRFTNENVRDCADEVAEYIRNVVGNTGR